MSAQNKGPVIGPKSRAINKPMTNTSIISNGDIVDAVTSGLRRAFAGTANAVKLIAGRTGRNPEAARNWLEGRNAPRAAELAELCRHFDEVFDEFCKLAGRIPPEQKRTQAEQLLEELAMRLTDHQRGKTT